MSGNANDRQVGGEHRTGAYKLTNKINGKVYVGGAYVSFAGRFKSHRQALNRNVHNNRHLQAAWLKYGSKSFIFSVLERVAPNEVKECEQKWIDFYRAADSQVGYNICSVAGSSLGVKRTDETKVKMSAAASKCQSRPEVKQKISLAHRGKILTTQHKSNVSKCVKLWASNPAVRQRLSDANRGKVMSQEQREKISSALKGRPHSDEHNRKVSRSLTGRKASPEAVEKMKRKVFSEDQRRKMSEAAKRRCRTPEGLANLRKAGKATHGLKRKAR